MATTMPAAPQVTVFYGPYFCSGIITHKTPYLEGLQAALGRHGHVCTLEKSHELNKVDIIVCGEIVFSCHIKELEFGGDGNLDPVCKEAVAAVKEAARRKRPS